MSAPILAAEHVRHLRGVPRILSLAESTLLRINVAMVYAGMIAVVVFCFGQAVDRYTIKSSFDAHDQLAKVGLVWLVFSGMAVAYAKGENLRIDLLARRLPPKVVRARDAIYEGVILLVCVLLHWKGWQVLEVAGFQQIMGTPFTNALPYSALLMATATIGVTCTVRLAATLSGGRKENV